VPDGVRSAKHGGFKKKSGKNIYLVMTMTTSEVSTFESAKMDWTHTRYNWSTSPILEYPIQKEKWCYYVHEMWRTHLTINTSNSQQSNQEWQARLGLQN